MVIRRKLKDSDSDGDVNKQKEIIDGNASDGSKNTRSEREVNTKEGVVSVVSEKDVDQKEIKDSDSDGDVNKEKKIIDGNASDGSKNTRSEKEMNAKEGVVYKKDSDHKEIKDSDRSDSTSTTDSTDSPTESTHAVTTEKKKEFDNAFGPQTEDLDKS